MTSTTYIPRTGSLADRVLGYLRANPDEELTTRDISVKFDVPQSSIKPCLATAENHGELDYTRNEELEYVYRLPKQPKAPKTPAPPPAEPAPAKTSKHSPPPGHAARSSRRLPSRRWPLRKTSTWPQPTSGPARTNGTR